MPYTPSAADQLLFRSRYYRVADLLQLLQSFKIRNYTVVATRNQMLQELGDIGNNHTSNMVRFDRDVLYFIFEDESPWNMLFMDLTGCLQARGTNKGSSSGKGSDNPNSADDLSADEINKWRWTITMFVKTLLGKPKRNMYTPTEIDIKFNWG